MAGVLVRIMVNVKRDQYGVSTQLIFEGTGNFSNKTGADKHTSRFLFGSKASASAQKKLWKKERDQEIELTQLRSDATD